MQKTSTSKNDLKPNLFLRELFLERKERNHSYSTRAFARDIGISQAYVSLLLNDKKTLTLKQAIKISALLQLDSKKTETLINSIFVSASTHPSKIKKSLKLSFQQKSNDTWFQDLSVDRFTAISRWYHVAILDLITTKNFKEDPAWIAARLNITAVEVKDAMARLSRLGFITRKGKQLIKATPHLYFQTQNSELAVRKHHTEMIQKGIQAMDETSEADFKKRSITGITLAVDLSRLEEAKNKIKVFQKEMAELTTGDASTEVYQLNVQFFSLTKEIR